MAQPRARSSRTRTCLSRHLSILLPLAAALADRESPDPQKTRSACFIQVTTTSTASRGIVSFSEILRWGKTRALLEARMATVCDTVEAGDETMFPTEQREGRFHLSREGRRLAEETSCPRAWRSNCHKVLQAPVLTRSGHRYEREPDHPTATGRQGSHAADRIGRLTIDNGHCRHSSYLSGRRACRSRASNKRRQRSLVCRNCE